MAARIASVALAALGLAGCNRQARGRVVDPGRPPAGALPATMVALPEELSEEQVRLVQRALASAGWRVDETGRFDRATRDALLAFQRSVGLPATGNVNAEAAARLGLAPEVLLPRAERAAAGSGEPGGRDAGVWRGGGARRAPAERPGGGDEP
jgi:peptidoglycan hydrolase-like protein with peptidoglycan-binding domain